MSSYHETATTTVAPFNPYLPAIGRVLEVLRGYGPPGTTIEICNRDLGRAAGCSAGRIPALLRTLEADGLIERATGTRGSLLMVTDQHVDRSFRPSQSDQHVDRPIVTATPDRSESVAQSDQHVDPPHTPLYGTKHDSTQQQQPCGREALWDAIVAAGGAAVVQEILDKNPTLTLAEFEHMQRAASTRGSRQSEDSIGLVFWCLKHNQPLHAPKEAAHVQRPASTRRRATPNRAGRDGDQALNAATSITPAEFAALPRRGTARLQALLEQRARQGGSGAGAQ